MHVLTGLLLTTLFGRKQKKETRRIPSFPGVVETVHLLPGRVRFRVPSLADDAAGRELLRRKLIEVQAIDSVEITPLSGSVLIRFDAESLEPELLFAAVVRLLGLESKIEGVPSSLIGRELRDAGEAVNHAIYERTGGILDLWTGLPLVLILLGASNLVAGSPKGLQSGWMLLWWAYLALFPPGRTSKA
jgi:hypothetical protein